jgi:hypothetical protein
MKATSNAARRDASAARVAQLFPDGPLAAAKHRGRCGVTPRDAGIEQPFSYPDRKAAEEQQGTQFQQLAPRNVRIQSLFHDVSSIDIYTNGP